MPAGAAAPRGALYVLTPDAVHVQPVRAPRRAVPTSDWQSRAQRRASGASVRIKVQAMRMFTQFSQLKETAGGRNRKKRGAAMRGTMDGDVAAERRLDVIKDLLKVLPRSRGFRVHADGSVSVYPAPSRAPARLLAEKREGPKPPKRE